VALKRRPPAVELAGFLHSVVGAGEAARRYLTALRAAGVPVRTRDVALPGRDTAAAAFRAGSRLALPARFNLICLNPEHLMPYLASSAAPRARWRSTLAAWNWEVDVLPPGWQAAARCVSEVWACSEFTAERIRSATGAQVIAMPLPLAAPQPAGAVAPAPELPPGFRVLVIFDYLSTIQRKNPLGAIEAYRQAFSPTDGAQLIIKSINGAHRPEQRAAVERAAGGRTDVALIDGAISGPERDALVEACDCLLSLHRSEGFGLSLADAMAAGKPVIATRYGGNTEFMTERNSYLVGYEQTTVGPGCEHYPAEAAWAEPDVAAAAAALRAVAADPAESRRRGLRAQADVRVQLAPERIGRLMADRLAALA
jgi:glycosyltransferase involved in cell wall biosynthesis